MAEQPTEQRVQLALPPAVERTMRQAPGLFSICWDGLMRAAQLGVNGAIAGAVIGLAAAFSGDGGAGIIGLAQSFGVKLGLTGVMGAVASGAATGAISGAVVGLPLGCVRGVQNMVQFYHNVAVPQILSQGLEQGVQIGAELEHQAMTHQLEAQQHTQQSNQFRNAITRRNPSFEQQRVNEQAAQVLSQLNIR